MEGKIVVLIPSLNPDEKLMDYVEGLLRVGMTHILLVDDGSRQQCQWIFERLEQLPAVTVLHHGENRGKGRALKTGFSWCLEQMPDCLGVVTADSDGQHRPQDTKKVVHSLLEHPESLILGTRDFNEEQVPFKSRYGNRITSVVFALLYGSYLHDTQTGLRGVGRKWLQPLCQLSGERFEYEIRMLIFAARKKIPMKEVRIETIYINDNQETHFRPVRDSAGIYVVMFSSFLKYLFSSLSASLIDMGLFALLHLLVFRGMTLGRNVFLSTLVARAVSSFYNFLVNRQMVFQAGGNFCKNLLSYYSLVLVQLGCSAGLVWLFTDWLHWPAVVVKALVDTGLFLISFQIQQRWVFRD